MCSEKFQVCVAGAGPAGICAAVAAARTGARTILVERYGFPGGLATAGLVGPISKFNSAGRRIVGGIPQEFIEAMRKANGAVTDLPSGNIPFDSEVYKYTALDLLRSAGVMMLFHATVVETRFSDDGTLCSITVSSNGARRKLSADYYIDCTGNGSLIAGSSALWQPRSRANSQPLSLIFKLGGVETDRLNILMAEDGVRYANAKLRKELSRAVEESLISNFGGPWTVWGSTIRPHEVSVNCTRGSADITNPFAFSALEVELRRQIPLLVELFRRSDPAFAGAYLQETATTVGQREARELRGAYRLRAEDVLHGICYDDTVALGAHPVDCHLPDGSGQKVTFLARPYGIPYRTLYSSAAPNLFAAGALCAAAPEAFASLRVQAQCMATGEAAGTAAALCNRFGFLPWQLPSERLLDTLKQQMVILK